MEGRRTNDWPNAPLLKKSSHNDIRSCRAMNRAFPPWNGPLGGGARSSTRLQETQPDALSGWSDDQVEAELSSLQCGESKQPVTEALLVAMQDPFRRDSES